MSKRKPFLQTLGGLKCRCTEEGQCWLWHGSEDGQGRPVAIHMGKRHPARRLARQFADGKEVPADKVVTSTCGNLACISPECSVITTNAMAHKMAAARGDYRNAERDRRMALSKRAQSTISDELVERIRAADNGRKAADETGVSYSHAKAIRAGRSRKDYSSPFAGLGAQP
jgi:hypothetical protein